MLTAKIHFLCKLCINGKIWKIKILFGQESNPQPSAYKTGTLITDPLRRSRDERLEDSVVVKTN